MTPTHQFMTMWIGNGGGHAEFMVAGSDSVLLARHQTEQPDSRVMSRLAEGKLKYRAVLGMSE
jgi:hypothetical protein